MSCSSICSTENKKIKCLSFHWHIPRGNTGVNSQPSSLGRCSKVLFHQLFCYVMYFLFLENRQLTQTSACQLSHAHSVTQPCSSRTNGAVQQSVSLGCALGSRTRASWTVHQCKSSGNISVHVREWKEYKNCSDEKVGTHPSIFLTCSFALARSPLSRLHKALSNPVRPRGTFGLVIISFWPYGNQ